jgi:hypothetical protein
VCAYTIDGVIKDTAQFIEWGIVSRLRRYALVPLTRGALLHAALFILPSASAGAWLIPANLHKPSVKDGIVSFQLYRCPNSALKHFRLATEHHLPSFRETRGLRFST